MYHQFDTRIRFTDLTSHSPPTDAKEYIFPAVPSVYNPIVAIHHHKDFYQFELKDGQKSQLETDVVLKRMSMTPEQIKSASFRSNSVFSISVDHNGSTFKGSNFNDAGGNFNTTFGNYYS